MDLYLNIRTYPHLILLKNQLAQSQRHLLETKSTKHYSQKKVLPFILNDSWWIRFNNCYRLNLEITECNQTVDLPIKLV